jgi:crotonobetainyl-CoA:carnitine CoA-transferase CaiB-like acyl-CoA transferase
MKERVFAPLRGYRILDLTDEMGYLAGKILGDLGAEVIKIEPPGGDENRWRGFSCDDRSLGETSCFWKFFNMSKSSITLDITKQDGRELLDRLVHLSDVVLESLDSEALKKTGIIYERLREVKSNIIVTSISPFGREGPWSKYKASDLTLWAAGGILYICGDPDRPPVQVSYPQSYLNGGAAAATSTVMALYCLSTAGIGQHIDVSILASIPWPTVNILEYWSGNQVLIRRQGPARMRGEQIKDRQIWKCRDGHVHFVQLGGKAGARYMSAVTKWMEEEGAECKILKEKKWEEQDMLYLSQELYDQFEEPFEAFFRERSKEYLYENGVKRGVQLCAVRTIREQLYDEQLKAREFWKEIHQPDRGSEKIKYPGPFVKSSNGELRLRRAPLVGENSREVYCDLLGL